MIWMELSMDSVTSMGSGWREVKVLTWKWQGGQLTGFLSLRGARGSLRRPSSCSGAQASTGKARDFLLGNKAIFIPFQNKCF